MEFLVAQCVLSQAVSETVRSSVPDGIGRGETSGEEGWLVVFGLGPSSGACIGEIPVSTANTVLLPLRERY